MAEAAYRIALVCEDEAHVALATGLIDRIVLHEAREAGADYIDEETIDYYRRYSGLRGNERYYPLTDARRDVEVLDRRPMIGGRPVRLTGHIRGRPLCPEAAMWRRIFALFVAQDAPPAAIIVVRDTDRKEARLSGLEQALELMRVEVAAPLPIVAATPEPEAEAWLVAGFVPVNENERKRLVALAQKISFDPTRQPHRLSAGSGNAPTDAKRVLRILFFDEDESKPPSREELPDVCDRAFADLALLRERGGECLLVAFLEDVRSTLVPVLVPGARLVHGRP